MMYKALFRDGKSVLHALGREGQGNGWRASEPRAL